jgi:hypothetical protein
MDVLDGVLLVGCVFSAFGVLAMIAGVFDAMLNMIERAKRRRKRSELLPAPNVRAVVRCAWNVPR